MIGVAGAAGEAVELARKHRPGLVSPTCSFEDNDSGIMWSGDHAVDRSAGHLRHQFSDDDGDRVETGVIVTKPFDPETLKVAIVKPCRSPRRRIGTGLGPIDIPVLAADVIHGIPDCRSGVVMVKWYELSDAR